MDISRGHNIESPQLSLFTLPLEIRHQIYGYVLPLQAASLTPISWVKTKKRLNTYMSLTLANKRVSHEVRDIFYGSTSVTIYINAMERKVAFLDSVQHLGLMLPMLFKPSVANWRHWQLYLIFPTEYENRSREWHCPFCELILGMGTLDYCKSWNHEIILSTAGEMVKCSELETLKIILPCLCKKGHHTPDEAVIEAVQFVLDPLARLRFKKCVTVIAAETNTFTYVHYRLYGEQCTEPCCLTFARRLTSLTSYLSESTPPTELSDRELKWMALKRQAASLEWTPDLCTRLKRVWRRVIDLWGLGDFDLESEDLRKFIERQLSQEPRTADKDKLALRGDY